MFEATMTSELQLTFMVVRTSGKVNVFEAFWPLGQQCLPNAAALGIHKLEAKQLAINDMSLVSAYVR
jgi:hypothetical protein